MFIFWPIDKLVKVSLRVVTWDVPPQDVITRDNVSLKVNAVVYYLVTDANKAIIAVENFRYAVEQAAQTGLRSVLGEVELDDLLAERAKLNARLQSILDEQTEVWGVKVAQVQVKQVDLRRRCSAPSRRRRRRTHSSSQGHRGAGRVSSGDETGRGRGRAEPRADIGDVAVFANAHRNRDGTEHDDRVSAAVGAAWSESVCGSHGARATISGPAARRRDRPVDRW